ncbi:MAG: VWA domain-containing protein [Acidimicrobiales bacterium]
MVLPVVVVAWRRWPPPLSPGRSRLALGLHVALVVLLVGALADVRVSRRPGRRAVVAVVDLSDSVGASREEAAATVSELIGAKGPDDVFGLVTFGRDAQVEFPPTRTPGFAGFQTRPDPTFSDLGGALQLAGNLLPEGYARQVVVVSDGRQNVGDAALVVGQLRRRSVRVDVVGLGTTPSGEALVVALEAPHEVRAGEAVTATARLRADRAVGGRVVLQVDGQAAAPRVVEVPAGDSAHVFELGVLEPGVHRLRVELEPATDRFSQNNAGEALVRVLGRPSVLVLEGAPGAGTNVAAAARAAGMDVETRRAEDTPADVATLTRFDSIVVADARVELFPAGALEAIATAVKDFGRGLVATGGSQSYGPGGWKDTPLEQVLPVTMDPPKPKEKPSVAVVLVLETLEDRRLDSMALGAAEGIVDQLTPTDELGVLDMGSRRPKRGTAGGPCCTGGAFGDAADLTIVPFAAVTDPEEIKGQLKDAKIGDPEGYRPGLTTAFDALRSSTAAVKHVIIVGDGDALGDVGVPHAGASYSGPLPDYRSLLQASREAGITTSVIDGDTHHAERFRAHMRSIAALGGGTYYLPVTGDDVPKIVLSEARSSLRPWYEQEPFFPKVTSAGDLLAGVPLDVFPQLGGHVVTNPKASADVLLAGPKGDPVLATGQYGLGRAVAWTSDARGLWTGGFLASPVSSTLFGRMVAWSLPSGGPEQVRVEATPRGDGLDVTVAGPAEGGDLQVEVVPPGGARSTEQLRPVAPGQWRGLVPAAEVGTYLLHAVLRRGGGVVGQGELSVPVPYSPEYLELGRDDSLLRQLASQGGELLARPASAWSRPTPPISVSSPIFWLFVLLAALIWPLDVATRRLTISVPKILALIRTERASHRRAVRAAPDAAARLRSSMAARRTRQSTAAPTPSEAINGREEGDGRQEPAMAARLLEARRGRKAAGEDP